MIVVTHQNDYERAGVEVVHSVDQALAKAGGDEVFIGGGAGIYRQTIDRADKLYLTVIEKEFPGDAFFPAIDLTEWQMESEEKHELDGQFEFPYSFAVYRRRV